MGVDRVGVDLAEGGRPEGARLAAAVGGHDDEVAVTGRDQGGQHVGLDLGGAVPLEGGGLGQEDAWQTQPLPGIVGEEGLQGDANLFALCCNDHLAGFF